MLWRAYLAKHGKPWRSVRTITEDDAAAVYWDEFWLPLRAGSIKSAPVAVMLFVFAANAGTSDAARMVQHVLNVDFGTNLVVDGSMGPKTVSVLNGLAKYADGILAGLVHAQVEHYRKQALLPGQAKWLRGWLARAMRGAVQAHGIGEK